MAVDAVIELTGLKLAADIGSYGPDDVVPEAHLLDLRLTVDPALVLVAGDGMAHVFDYDPLIRTIDALARDGHYETQERLLTRIVEACAAYQEIAAVEIGLSKTPVLDGTGTLGLRASVDGAALARIRAGAV